MKGFYSSGDERIPGNFGLKDQAMAINWIHDHIQAFGGNPKKITLFGESAGAVSVHLHMMHSSVKGKVTEASFVHFVTFGTSKKALCF